MNYNIYNSYMDISVYFRMEYFFIGILYLEVTSCTATLVQTKIHGILLLWYSLNLWLQMISTLEILQLK